jgi:hypothetical protein
MNSIRQLKNNDEPKLINASINYVNTAQMMDIMLSLLPF